MHSRGWNSSTYMGEKKKAHKKIIEEEEKSAERQEQQYALKSKFIVKKVTKKRKTPLIHSAPAKSPRETLSETRDVKTPLAIIQEPENLVDLISAK